MQMQSIRGKNIVSAGYDPVDGILAVQFAKSGLYRFKGVPENIWVSLRRVPFPDKYFTQTVKGKYPVEKPEKVSNGTTSDVQDTAGRDGNSGDGVADRGSNGRDGPQREAIEPRRRATGGRCDAQSSGR